MMEAVLGHRSRTVLSTILVWGLAFTVSGYFVLHALGVGGQAGYFSLGDLDRRIAAAESELAELREHRQWLEHRIALVSEDTVDADMLGELARRQGGLFAADEIIININ